MSFKKKNGNKFEKGMIFHEYNQRFKDTYDNRNNSEF